MVNWNSRQVTVGQIIGSNLKVKSVKETKKQRIFTCEVMLPAGFEADDVEIRTPLDAHDYPLEQARGA